MLAWSLEALARSRHVGAIAIAAPPGDEATVERLAREWPAQSEERPGGEGSVSGSQASRRGERGPRLHVVAGGQTRSESVAAAFTALAEAGDGAEFAAVHDAARPLVTPALIDELIETLASRPDAAGVIAAAPLTDTVKRAREARPAEGEPPRGRLTVARTESRDHLWAAQTPQVFRAPALRDALALDPERLRAASDDARLVEQAGGTVLIQPSSPENLKVTTPFDLRMAELLLRGRA